MHRINQDIGVHIMKKKLCLLLTEMIILMFLTCSCSCGQKMEQITGSIADDSLKTISPEQSDAEADNIETDGAETDDAADSITTLDLNHI